MTMRRAYVPRILIGVALAVALAACGSDNKTGKTANSGYLQTIKDRGFLKIGVAKDQPPFGSIAPGASGPTGFEVDYGRLIAKSILGSPEKVKFVGVTTATRIPLLQQGDVDLVIATLTITPERKTQVGFSRPYYPSGIGAMVSADSPIKSFSELSGKTDCTATGSLAHKYFVMALKENNNLVAVANSLRSKTLPTSPDCVLALKQHRGVDFMADDTGILVGESQQTSGLRVIPEVVGEDLNTWGIGVGKGRSDLVQAVNSAICDVFASGDWKKLYQKWVHSSPPSGWPPKC